MATIGEQLLKPEAGWRRYEETEVNIVRTGTWYDYSGTDVSGGLFVYTPSSGGGTLSFNFIGTKLRFIGAQAGSTTSVDIFIDGVLVNTFSQNSRTTLRGTLDAEVLGLQNKEHYVKIVNNGAQFAFDAIDIDDSGSIIPYNPNPEPSISAPTNLTATAGDSKVSLSWTAATNATGYNVKRSTTAGGPYTTVGANVSGTTYVDTTVTNGTTYYYVVTALTADGESGNSNEASATPKAGSVTPPTPTGNTLLRVTMIDSSEREYRLSSAEVDGFVNWFNRYTVTDTKSYMLSKTFGKEYLAFDKIISFEVIPVIK